MPNVYSKMMPVIDNKIEAYEDKWFKMAYYGNGKPEDIVRMAYYGNGKPEDIEEFLLKINKPLHNKIFNKKWHFGGKTKKYRKNKSKKYRKNKSKKYRKNKSKKLI